MINAMCLISGSLLVGFIIFCIYEKIEHDRRVHYLNAKDYVDHWPGS
jgi:hypothetical protein